MTIRCPNCGTPMIGDFDLDQGHFYACPDCGECVGCNEKFAQERAANFDPRDHSATEFPSDCDRPADIQDREGRR